MRASQSVISKDAGEQKNNKVFITHLKQIHWPPFGAKPTSELLDRIAFSQYQIAKVILANPNAIVLYEGLTKNLLGFDLNKQQDFSLDPDVLSLYEYGIRENLLKSFRLGIPNSFSELNEEQKALIAEHGGDKVLYYLKKLNSIYQTITPEKYLNHLAQVRKELTKLLTDKELYKNIGLISKTYEEEAIYWAKQAALQSGMNHVLLIFGKGHDFQARIQQMNDPSVCLYKEIDTSVPCDFHQSIPDPLDIVKKEQEAKEKEILKKELTPAEVMKIVTDKYPHINREKLKEAFEHGRTMLLFTHRLLDPEDILDEKRADVISKKQLENIFHIYMRMDLSKVYHQDKFCTLKDMLFLSNVNLFPMKLELHIRDLFTRLETIRETEAYKNKQITIKDVAKISAEGDALEILSEQQIKALAQSKIKVSSLSLLKAPSPVEKSDAVVAPPSPGRK